MSYALAGRLASAHWGKLREFEDRYFTRRNLRMYGLAWVASNAVTLAWFFLRGSWPFVSKTRPSDCIDFGWMWITGRFAASDPARLYDFAAFTTAQSDLFGVGNCVLPEPFIYPPTLLFFTYPFGLLPFIPAFVLWNAVLLLFFLAAIYVIVRRANAIIGALTLRPLQVDLYVGHNGLLTTGLMGSSLLLLERIALAAHAAVALVLAMAVWLVWSKPISYPVRAAMLCIASLLATPYAFNYDFCMLAIAFAFLMEDGLVRGFLTGERIAMLFCGTVLLSAGLRAGPIMVCAVLLWLIWRRIAMLRVQEARV